MKGMTPGWLVIVLRVLIVLQLMLISYIAVSANEVIAEIVSLSTSQR